MLNGDLVHRLAFFDLFAGLLHLGVGESFLHGLDNRLRQFV
jgi:hypothetical protein